MTHVVRALTLRSAHRQAAIRGRRRRSRRNREQPKVRTRTRTRPHHSSRYHALLFYLFSRSAGATCCPGPASSRCPPRSPSHGPKVRPMIGQRPPRQPTNTLLAVCVARSCRHAVQQGHDGARHVPQYHRLLSGHGASRATTSTSAHLFFSSFSFGSVLPFSSHTAHRTTHDTQRKDKNYVLLFDDDEEDGQKCKRYVSPRFVVHYDK